MSLRTLQGHVTGNANTLVAASIIALAALEIGDNSRQKIRALSALVTVLAETNTLTFAGKWQVSNDGATWIDVANGSQNAASVVLATGTSGADAAVSRAIQAPDAIYGWRKARFVLVTGVATGAVGDTYDMSYSYRAD